MARRTITYAIRLAVEGGGQVKAELVSVGQSGDWADAELAFQGSATPEVLHAWRRRFARMTALRCSLGESRFARVRDDFLGCLAGHDHESDARVVMVIARKPGRPSGRPINERC